MSTFSPIEQQGAWGPQLREPMPVPLTDLEAPPQLSFCFNERWLPALLTAMKLLTRPETWVGTQDDVQRAVRTIHLFMGSWRDECGVIEPVVNWDLITSNFAGLGPRDGKWQLLEPPPVENKNYEGEWEPDLVSPPDVLVKAVDHDNPTLNVGGTWTEFAVQSTGLVEQAYTITRSYCTGSPVVDTGFTPYILGSQANLKSIRVTAGARNIIIRASIQGSWTCGPV